MKNALHDTDFGEQSGMMPGYPIETVVKLYEFGGLLLNSVQQRANQIDSKLGVYLAFSAAIIALLGASGVRDDGAVRYALVVSGGAAVVSLLASFLGLRSRQFAFPGYSAWFDKREINNDDRLLRSYVLAMLASYKHQFTAADHKAFFMPIAEYFLVLSALAAVVMLTLKLI